jgi:hypothetical protein
MLFHLNDKPIDMDIAKDLCKNDLKPDIVAVTLDRARQAYKIERSPVTWDDFIFGIALRKPRQSFQWEWLLCSHEVQLVKKTLSGPPEHYLTQAGGPEEQPYTDVAIEAVLDQPATATEAVPVPGPST